MFGRFTQPQTVIPGRGRPLPDTNPESQHGSLRRRKTLRDSGLIPVRCAARPAPEMTIVGYSNPNSRSSRRIGSGIASMDAAALPRSGGASLSVR